MKSNTITTGYGRVIPPLRLHVIIYFEQRGMPHKQAEAFFEYYKARKWRNKYGHPLKNWKLTATQWIGSIQRLQQKQPRFFLFNPQTAILNSLRCKS